MHNEATSSQNYRELKERMRSSRALLSINLISIMRSGLVLTRPSWSMAIHPVHKSRVARFTVLNRICDFEAGSRSETVHLVPKLGTDPNTTVYSVLQSRIEQTRLRTNLGCWVDSGSGRF